MYDVYTPQQLKKEKEKYHFTWICMCTAFQFRIQKQKIPLDTFMYRVRFPKEYQ